MVGIRLLLAVAIVGVVFCLTSSSAPSVDAAVENAGDNFNLGDTMISETNNTTNYGTTGYVQIGDDGATADRYGLILFDISNIPAAQVIDNAQMWWYADAGMIVGNPTLHVHGMDNRNWDENVITWDLYDNNKTASLDSEVANVAPGWETWEVGTYVQTVYTASENVSLVFRSSDYGANTRWLPGTKEAATPHPYLEIWYSPFVQPTASITIDNIHVDDGQGPDVAIDSDNDGYLSDGDDNVMILAYVTDNNGLDNLVHARITIYDSNDAKLIDNAAFDNSADENSTTRLYQYNYNPSDAIGFSDLGDFDIEVEILDVDGWENILKENQILYVDDFEFYSESADNLAGHVTHFQGFVRTGSSSVSAPGSVTIVDNTIGTYNTIPNQVDYKYENSYSTPAFGHWYAYTYENGRDGQTDDNTVYRFPNIPIGLVTLTVDNALIDNHRSDNAITATIITIIFEDNDGFADFALFNDNQYFITVRAADDEIIENDNSTATASFENENRVIFTFLYDAEDNTGLDDANLGAWDVQPYVGDQWSSYSIWTLSVFTVEEVGVTVNLTALDAPMGFAFNENIIVNGTIIRKSGAGITVTYILITDENVGDLEPTVGAAYTENYPIGAASGTDNVYVRVWAYAGGGLLDGENFNYYDVNDNRLYNFEVRYEENYELWLDGTGGDNAIDNRNYRLTFYFDNYQREIFMLTNPDNYVVVDEPYKVRLDFLDNAFWRTRIPTDPGMITFVMPDDLDNLNYYRFFLTDLTGLFGKEENGQLWLSRFYEDNFMQIHEDYWSPNNDVISWLLYGSQYNVKVVTPIRERSTAPAIMGTEDDFEVTIGTYRMPDAFEILDEVWYSAWWAADNTIRVSYRDNSENTVSSTVTIYDENDDVAHTVSFTTDNWALTWSSADPTTGYTIEIDIHHDNYSNEFGGDNFTVKTTLSLVWTPPLPDSHIPGMSQLGDPPIVYGSMIGLFFSFIVGLTFGKRHEGLAILAIAMFLVVLGPMLGVFVLPEIVIPLIAVIGVLVMLIPRKGGVG